MDTKAAKFQSCLPQSSFSTRFPVPRHWQTESAAGPARWKGGDSEAPGAEETPEPTVVEAQITTTEKVEAPETPMGAVFELGATQQAMHDLRSIVSECQAEQEQVNARVDDLESTLSQTLSLLREEIRDSRQTEETHRETRQASWLERMLGGHASNEQRR